MKNRSPLAPQARDAELCEEAAESLDSAPFAAKGYDQELSCEENEEKNPRRISLSGSWRMSGKDGKIAVAAEVPTDVFSALLSAGVITDPNLRQNELDLQWVGREEWIFERTFEIDQEFLRNRSVLLHADTLDTIAVVLVNGRQVAQSRSSFFPLRAEIRPLLVPGLNSLCVRFASPEKAAVQEAQKYPRDIPFMSFPIQGPHRNLLRKNQSHAGWDWGPCLLTSGILGDIYLDGTNAVRINNVHTKQRHGKNAVDVTVVCEVEAESRMESDLEIDFDGRQFCRPVVLAQGSNTLELALTVECPRLWWPAGYGEQPLYPLVVRLGGDEIKRQIGLRTITFVSEEDEVGRSFYFVVNGLSIFAKGSNWLPAEALPGRASAAHIEELLSSAAAANMNMIRVWGGGQYEAELFYELCDEKGLLVWQDFMFSCALYPATREFLELVRQEAVYQVKRLRSHACLAFWCGDNENLGAVRWFSGGSQTNRERNVADWAVLNKGVLRESVEEHDPERAFWPSSPCGGPDDFSDCWKEDSRGDMHHWDVWLQSSPFREYEKLHPRFCSEFGHQSFPSIDLVEKFTAPGQQNITAPDFEFHQRDKNGNARLMAGLLRHFRMPKSFEETVYVSQIAQGLAMQTAIEHFRRIRPRCMGVLYWQLNDVWPAISWSTLEYKGKWKLSHYMARRFFAPIMISTRETSEGRLEIWLANDTLQEIRGSLEVRFLRFNGEMIHQDRHECQISAQRVGKLCHYDFGEFLKEPTQSFVALSFRTASGTCRNVHLFAEPKKCEFPDVDISVGVTAVEGGFRIDLETNFPAFWCSLQACRIRGEFDDNAFALLPGEPRTLFFSSQHSVELQSFRRALQIRHIRASYADGVCGNP